MCRISLIDYAVNLGVYYLTSLYWEVRLSPVAVAGEVDVLQQCCGNLTQHCLESLEYTSGACYVVYCSILIAIEMVFSNGC